MSCELVRHSVVLKLFDLIVTVFANEIAIVVGLANLPVALVVVNDAVIVIVVLVVLLNVMMNG